MSRKRHVTITATNADLKRWLAANLLEVPGEQGVVDLVAIPPHITNVSQLATWIKYDLLLSEDPLLDA